MPCRVLMPCRVQSGNLTCDALGFLLHHRLVKLFLLSNFHPNGWRAPRSRHATSARPSPVTSPVTSTSSRFVAVAPPSGKWRAKASPERLQVRVPSHEVRTIDRSLSTVVIPVEVYSSSDLIEVYSFQNTVVYHRPAPICSSDLPGVPL